MERLHKNGITATDIATQFWCERQMELNCLHKPAPTKAMEKGSRMHEAWQLKVRVPIALEPRSYPDFLYKTAYENYMTLSALREKGVGREIMVYGSLNGYRISGKIDELRMKDGKVSVVEDKTVRQGMTVDEPHTRPHIVQIMLYRKLLEDIRSRSYSYENFANVFRLKGTKLSDGFMKDLASLKLKDEYLGLEGIWMKMFNEIYAMPELSNELEIRYVDRYRNINVSEVKVMYDPDSLNKNLSYAMQYWRGERESAPVIESENWKCKPCKFFGKECKVWWTGG
jgi:hypothetical protein